MKRMVLVALFLSLFSVSGWSAVNQPQGLGDVSLNKASLGLYTLAQINLLTPDTTGQMVACSDCTRSAVCISSGSDSGRIGAFVIIAATGPFVGATWSKLQHCQ